MENQYQKPKKKSFYEYAEEVSEERKKIELLNLNTSLQEANKARICAELHKDSEVKNLAKEIINEILNPASTSKKLTKKEQTEQ
ncbi:hypothetical protein [Pedobacter psychrodurus]|uniref:hypothetical protein n=1 Tax=Pedobacter psychrodurus TaxID=2530456 RepID=UPI00293152EC|nr:hypothetical protein [Pedobacter psychrodurus]